jgi:hypothetical protein
MQEARQRFQMTPHIREQHLELPSADFIVQAAQLFS